MICTNEDTKLINEIMRDFTNITKIAPDTEESSNEDKIKT